MKDVSGVFYDGHSSASVMATLSVNDHGIVHCRAVDKQGVEAMLAPSAPFDALKISSRLANTPRYLYFVNEGKFETIENDAIDSLINTYGRPHWLQWVSLMERRWRFVLVSLVLVIMLTFWALRDGVPLLAESIARALPYEASQMIGQGTLKILDEHLFSTSELGQQRQQELLGYFSLLTDQYPELNIQVFFRKGNDIGANAMALPSGAVVFTDELVNLADNDEQLLAILAHEIGHLAMQHALRRVVQSSMLSLAILSFSGDINAASSVLVLAPTVLMEMSYSREFEREADHFALNAMKDQGVGPERFAEIIQKLEQSHGVSARTTDNEDFNWSDYLSTHPSGKERIEAIQ